MSDRIKISSEEMAAIGRLLGRLNSILDDYQGIDADGGAGIRSGAIEIIDSEETFLGDVELEAGDGIFYFRPSQP